MAIISDPNDALVYTYRVEAAERAVIEAAEAEITGTMRDADSPGRRRLRAAIEAMQAARRK